MARQKYENHRRETIMRPVTPLWRALAAAFILSFAVQLAAQAKSQEIFPGLVKGVAVGGDDPVAYFTAHKPVPGKPEITLFLEGRHLAVCQ
jgi:hypothetical protein